GRFARSRYVWSLYHPPSAEQQAHPRRLVSSPSGATWQISAPPRQDRSPCLSRFSRRLAVEERRRSPAGAAGETLKHENQKVGPGQVQPLVRHSAFELHQERGERVAKSFDARLLFGVFQ